MWGTSLKFLFCDVAVGSLAVVQQHGVEWLITDLKADIDDGCGE